LCDFFLKKVAISGRKEIFFFCVFLLKKRKMVNYAAIDSVGGKIKIVFSQFLNKIVFKQLIRTAQ